MSREIDFSKPLSEDDQAYADERPWLYQDAKLSGIVEESGKSNDDGGSADDDDDAESSYNDLGVEQLKELLRERNLAVSGPKEVLVARLEEADAEEDDEEEDDEL